MSDESPIWCDCGERCHENNLRNCELLESARAKEATLRAQNAELVEALKLALRVIDEGGATEADEAGLNDAGALLARIAKEGT